MMKIRSIVGTGLGNQHPDRGTFRLREEGRSGRTRGQGNRQDRREGWTTAREGRPEYPGRGEGRQEIEGPDADLSWRCALATAYEATCRGTQTPPASRA